MASARFESSEEVGEPPDHQEDPEVDLDEIQRELEKLNSSGDTINSMESRLIQARAQFRKDYTTFEKRLEAMKKKDSNIIAKCEPLVKAKAKKMEMQEILNNAVARYDKANSQHAAAKELIQVAEQQLSHSASQNMDGVTMDQAWQETLNHATQRVVETALEKSHAEQEHKQAADDFTKAHLEHSELWKKLEKFFEKAKPYYTECTRCNDELKSQRKAIKELEEQIKKAKGSYSGALKALDALSCSIHEKRRATVTSRLKPLEDTNHFDYHGSSDKLSLPGDFEASMLKAVPSSSYLLSDDSHMPLNQEGLGEVSKSSSTESAVGRVAGELVANALDAALKSSPSSEHISNHLGSPPDPSGHHDNMRPYSPSGHHSVPSTLLDISSLATCSHISIASPDHRNTSDISGAPFSPHPISGHPTDQQGNVPDTQYTPEAPPPSYDAVHIPFPLVDDTQMQGGGMGTGDGRVV